MTEASAELEPAPTDEPGFLARMLRASGLVLVVMLAPALIVGSLLGGVAGMAIPFGMMGGIFASTGDGRLAARALFPIVVVGGALAAFTLGSWWWVALLVVLGALIGYLTALGRAIAIIEVCIVVTSSDKVNTVRDLILYTVFLAAGYVAGVFVGKAMGAPVIIRRPVLAHIDPMRASILGALSLGTAGAIAIATGWQKGYWLPMIFLILLEFLVVEEQGGRMVWFRIIGTLLGIGIIVPLLSQLAVPLQLVAFLLLVGAGLVLVSSRYWLASAFLTAAVVIVSSLGRDVTAIGQERLWATVWAALLVGGVAAAMSWVRRAPRPA